MIRTRITTSAPSVRIPPVIIAAMVPMLTITSTEKAARNAPAAGL